MRAKELQKGTWALVFDVGDEAMEGLGRFVSEHGIAAARFTAIGAFSDCVLAYFDWESKEYEEHPLEEQAEVLALTGDVADGRVHAHVVVGLRDTTARGGHLLRGHVRPTLELILDVAPTHLRKSHDPATGLAVIDLDT